MTPVFLDSNVFLYAAGAGHPLRAPCQALLTRVGNGALAATTSVEVVQEVMHVAARRGRRDAAAALADALLALFPGLLSVTPAVVSRACELFRGHTDLSVRDALHAATMLENGIDTIVTTDRHFDGLDRLRRIDPSRAGRLRPPAR
ncbi:MAG: type II toxin-antitoxin system VapC family toxin [Acidobacteria bacterium]|jgi:hypothetical protein|nr:type II toxin-antitoxin system VapC family toxin [Acidobacteriota bacterium]